MKIELTKDILKRISNENYYNEEDFIKDCKCYIKALKAGRVQYKVTHVSSSGMSRNIVVQSYEGTMLKGYYRQYGTMFQCLGENLTRDNEIRMIGCGMNMCFALNYNTIRSFYRMKFISKKDCDKLAQII